MTERGKYRSITAALVDGPDYQRLTPQARLVLVTLKITLGPSGIELRYPASLREELEHRTGFANELVVNALAELEDRGWIRYGDNLVWIVEQLRFEPQFHATNPKHRKAIQLHVNGLPHVALVEAFKRHYAEYFPGTSEGLSSPPEEPADSLSGRPSDSLSHSPSMAYAIQGKGKGKGDRNKYGAFLDDAFEAAWKAYPKRTGGNPKQKARKAWTARIREGVTTAEMTEGVHRYAAHCTAEKVDPRFVMHASTFFGPDRRYAEEWASRAVTRPANGYCSPAELQEAYG